MSNDIRKLMKLVESASLNEKDAPTADTEVDVPLANMPRDMSTRDEAGRVAHADVAYNVGADKVIATLQSYNSQVYTKLAQKLQRIDELEAEVKKLKEETKTAVRADVAELFAVEDFTRTRVIETKQFIFTLSKDPKATEAPKYKDILEELSKSLTPELISVLEGLKKTMITTTQKAASLKLATKESMNEGIWDTAKDVLAGFFAKVKAWGVQFDSKLAALKAQAGVMESEEYNVEIPEGIDYSRVDRIEKQVDFMAGRGRSRDEIVANITSKMGDVEGEHAATYFDTMHGVSEDAVDAKPAMTSSKQSPFGEKYRVKEDEIASDEEAEDVSESDLDSSEERLMREYTEMMETMAFSMGQVVYCGSRAGKVIGDVPGVPDAIMVQLSNGEQVAFKKKDCSNKRPGLLKKAASWVVGEDSKELALADNDAHTANEPDADGKIWFHSYKQWIDASKEKFAGPKPSLSGHEITAYDKTGTRKMAGIWDLQGRKGWLDTTLFMNHARVKEDEMEADEAGLTEWDDDVTDADFADDYASDHREEVVKKTDFSTGEFDVEVPFPTVEALVKFMQLDFASENLQSMADVEQLFDDQWSAVSAAKALVVRGDNGFAYKGAEDNGFNSIDLLPQVLQDKLAPYVDKSQNEAVESWNEDAQGGFDDEGKGYGPF
jgi:hypothetical protein